MKIVTTEQMRRIEQAADAGGLPYATMMENAGRAVALAIEQQLAPLAGKLVLILIGPGNNGGDGLVAGRYLRHRDCRVHHYVWKRRTEGDENFRLAQELDIPCTRAGEDEGLSLLREQLSKADVVVDALLGTGVSRPIEGRLKELLEVTKSEIERRRTGDGEELTVLARPTPSRPPSPFVVAVDVPSGLNCDTGEIDPAALPADLTVTFGFPKVGQFIFPGAAALGQLVVADIGIPPALAEESTLEVATAGMVAGLLPARPPDAHKGTFGKAMVVAGSINYTGAAYLAAAAATRVGTGLVTLAIARSLYPALAAKISEATFLLLPQDMGVLIPEATKLLRERMGDYDVLLLGPGLGREEETVEFVQQLVGGEPAGKKRHIGFVPTTKAARGEDTSNLPPLVIDADGLNALADAPEWWQSLPPGTILTPHPGEMARLVGCSAREVQADRVGCAREMAGRWEQVVVLKGAYTLIAAPDGQLVINPFANAGLATAGSGDVLAGVIAGFRAQGLEPAAAAIAGVYIHGLAGELARGQVGEAGMVAGDLVPLLPRAIGHITNTLT